MDEVYSCVCPRCSGFKVNAKGDLNFNLDDEIEKLIHELYNGHSTKLTAKQIANKVAATLAGAVSQGYGKGVFDVDWDSPDRKQIENLQRNTYHFSFAKCNEQLKAANAALHSNGKIVSPSEFRDIVKRIDSDYSGRYIRVEYNTAIASGQMGSRWVFFQEEKETFPNLTYRTVGDKNVRDSHAALDGVTRAIDDFIWDTIFTPNGWGCRCDIEQSEGEKITPVSKIIIPDDIPPMFKTNLAKNGLVFPADHPYFENLPDAVIKAADNNNPFLYEKTHSGKKGGYVYESALHPKGADWEHEFTISKVLANSGEKVVLLPEINPNTEWKEALRNLVLPDGVKEGKNADAILNGDKVVEFKTSNANTVTSLKELIRTGAKQSDVICIKLTDKMPLKDVKRALKGQVKQSKNVEEIWMIDAKDKLIKYSKEDISDFFKSKKQK